MGRFGLGQENWTHIQFCDVLLTEQLLPVMRDISGEFNQSINQSSRACETISVLERQTPAFIRQTCGFQQSTFKPG